MDAARIETARRALGLLDLTNLNDGCTAADVDALCAAAVTPHGPVAAVCVWPAFVAQAKSALDGQPVKIATVANFPGGAADPEAAARQTAEAAADGADEVDVVVPWRAFLDGAPEAVTRLTRACRDAAPASVALKTILETGDLAEPAQIEDIARRAVAGGSDFLKTSTGKRPVGATPEAVAALLGVARDAGRPVGVKISGGVRTVADAAAYLALADEVMGPSWAQPGVLRIGASSLLGDLLDALA